MRVVVKAPVDPLPSVQPEAIEENGKFGVLKHGGRCVPVVCELQQSACSDELGEVCVPVGNRVCGWHEEACAFRNEL